MLFQNQISIRHTSAPKHYFELNAKDSGSDVEFLTRFVFEIYVVVMASTSRTRTSFANISKSTFQKFYLLARGFDASRPQNAYWYPSSYQISMRSSSALPKTKSFIGSIPKTNKYLHQSRHPSYENFTLQQIYFSIRP